MRMLLSDLDRENHVGDGEVPEGFEGEATHYRAELVSLIPSSRFRRSPQKPRPMMSR